LAQNAYYSSKAIVRNIEQDTTGNIWIASFDGVFRYDGKTFTNVMKAVSTARFFSVMEDREGALWFGSIGSGVYKYDGKTFQNFTTKEGLLNNEVGCIYEDKAGDIWFGVNGGASRFDGKSFHNYVIEGDVMTEDRTGKTLPDVRPPNEVTSIIEDRTGKLWFATRGNTYVYDKMRFTVFTHHDKPFLNVRTLIQDKRGDIWLGGNDGLWRYDGSAFVNFSPTFVGFIYEDRKGNIWTSSGSVNGQKNWMLSRYDEKALTDKFPQPPDIIKGNQGMIFGIMEASDGGIWFGTLDGVTRYDGKDFNSFR
jgi:ligand-binding sensor domain-containing protein